MTDYDPRLGLFIAGEWLSGGRETQEVTDPATGGAIGRLPLATTADLDRALEAAARGFALWRATPGDARGAILRRAAALIRERADRLADLATREQGKIAAEAKGETLAAAAALEFHAGEAERVYDRLGTNGARVGVRKCLTFPNRSGYHRIATPLVRGVSRCPTAFPPPIAGSPPARPCRA